jgi:CHAT domain-containing protein/tetratricopeptide (TPR) repeat protein
MTLHNLGAVQCDLNAPEAARDSLQEALAICRELARQRPDVYRPDVAGTLNHLGNVQRALNALEAARGSFQEALAICRELARQRPDVYRPDVALTLNNLGLVQRALNAPEAARDSYQEAQACYRELARQRPDVYRPFLAMTLTNLGGVQSDLNVQEMARDSYQEALTILRELATLRPDVYRPYVALTLNNLGTAQRALKALEAARNSYQEALAIRRELAARQPDVYRPYVATTLNNLAVVQIALNALESARDSFQEAAALYDADALAHPTAHLVERQGCWSNLGRLYLREHAPLGWPDYHKARAALRRANACTERFRGLFLDPSQRKRVQGEALHIADGLVRTCVCIGQASGDTDALREAVEVAEASRARNLMELLADETLQPANTPPDLADEFRDLRRRLRQAERQWQQEGTQPESPRWRAMQQRAAELRQQHQRLLDRIRANHDSEFNPDHPVLPVTFQDAVGLIPDDVPTAVVQYSLTADGGLALLITRQDVQAVVLPDLSERQGVELAAAWSVAYQYYQIRNNPKDPNRIHYAEKALREALPRYEAAFGSGWAQALWGLLANAATWDGALPALLEPVAARAVRPVVEALAGRGIRRLILSPNRGLHLFPLHACVLADGRYLSDACEVVYTPSLSILHRCASRRRCLRSRLFLVENPTCDLTFAELEGARLRRRYQPQRQEWLYGGEATNDKILQHSRDCHVLSYSGHAVFDPRDPLNSALVLGSVNRPQHWLTLRDVFTGLHLRQNLLTVLNGCESGLVEPDRVDEYVGLPSGFLYAGAACVLSTLWAVYDLSTALLIDRFHHEWHAGQSIAAALHAAQRWLREGISSGPDLRDRVLPELLAGLDDDHLKQECRRRAAYYAAHFPDRPPFAAAAHWAPFIATGLSYPLPPDAAKNVP